MKLQEQELGVKLSPKWIQKDLEEQIAEEKGLSFIKPSKKQTVNMSTETTKGAAKEVKISEIQDLLKLGYARLKKDDLGNGSIQEKYELTTSQVKDLFQHPKLKGLKVKVPGVTIVDDTPEVEPKAPKALEPAPEISAPVKDKEEDLFS